MYSFGIRHAVMIHVLCTRVYSAIEVERSRELYADLRSILILLEMEQSQVFRVKKNKNLRLPSKINFNRFLCEGIIYLGIINNLDTWVKPNSTKNIILRKILNNLGKVRFQYKRMLRMRNLLLKGIINNFIREDIIIDLNDVVQEEDLGIDSADIYDIEEYEVIEFYDWLSEKKRRTIFMSKVDLLIDKIYHVMVKKYLTLCSILKNYCRRVIKFLSRKKKILKSKKLHRRQINSCCQYHFLKQLITFCHRYCQMK